MAKPDRQSRHSRQFKPDEASPLLEYLLRALAPMNRTRVKELLRLGAVSVNSMPVTQFDYGLQAGDIVGVGKLQADPAASTLDKVGITIVYEDEWLILIDKPAGMLSIGTEKQKSGTAHHLVNQYLEKIPARAYVVHRLDRETSGLLLLAKSPAIQKSLQANWEATQKTYLAIVAGKPALAQGTIRSYLVESVSRRVYSRPPGGDARLAITHFRVLQSKDQWSVLEIQLETGRKHQIRVHLADQGTPIVGDTKYGAGSDPLRRMGLHAWKLRWIHPIRNEPMEMIAEIPNGFRRLGLNFGVSAERASNEK